MSYTYEFDDHPALYVASWQRGYVQRVIDGDTYYIRVDQGFHCAITIPVRLRGVNAPELKTPDGGRVAAEVRAFLEGQPVMVRTYIDKRSFARWVADVQYGVTTASTTPTEFTITAWHDLAAEVIARGWGVRYPG